MARIEGVQESPEHCCEAAGVLRLDLPSLWVEVSTWSWGLGCREDAIGYQERLGEHCPETSLELVLLLGCLACELRGGPWVRPEQKMAWKACWAGPQLRVMEFGDASVWECDA